MRIVEPIHFEHRKSRSTKKRSRHVFRLFFVMICVVALFVFSALRFLSPDLGVKPTAKEVVIPAKKVTLSWPSYGQAAVGARGFKVLDSHGADTPLPTASIAKVMTAFAVLRRYPLAPGEKGPTLTLQTRDVQLYNDYLAKNGSTVAVQAGEQITEYQAIQALLLPSANNMADSLAIWAFGSIDSYVAFANGLAKTIGLQKSHFADASGFSPDTVSTAQDLVLLGESVLLNDVMAEIINQSTADIPVAGTIKNVNFALGIAGINGIKTGNTDEAGGCFLVSAAHTFADGQKIIAVAAIMGAPNLNTALEDALPLLKSLYNGFGYMQVTMAGETVGSYSVPWAGTVAAQAVSSQKLFTWLGADSKITVQLKPLPVPVDTQASVGTATMSSGIFQASSDVRLARSVGKPTLGWRIKDIFRL